MVAVALWSIAEDQANAAAPGAMPAAALFYQADDVLPSQVIGGWFAKYDGVDGESIDGSHDRWINILRYEWGVEKPQGTVGESRRRGSAIVDDLVFEFEYEKAAPKLLEKCFRGEVIPQLDFELTTSVGEGSRVTYLKYEMKNVLCTMYEVGGWADGSPPTVVIANNFEEIKVTYSEYDDEGAFKGDIETEIKVEK
jgi:type VI secretion system secreted protein Hcp